MGEFGQTRAGAEGSSGTVAHGGARDGAGCAGGWLSWDRPRDVSHGIWCPRTRGCWLRGSLLQGKLFICRFAWPFTAVLIIDAILGFYDLPDLVNYLDIASAGAAVTVLEFLACFVGVVPSARGVM
jgi:hypothetical protein